jgi:hypothetical protein
MSYRTDKAPSQARARHHVGLALTGISALILILIAYAVLNGHDLLSRIANDTVPFLLAQVNR